MNKIIYLLIILAAFALSSCTKDEEQSPADKLGMKFVTVKGGTFLMGSPDTVGSADEHPQHNVTLSSFKINKYEVTATQYLQYLKDCGKVNDSLPTDISDHPLFYIETFEGWAGYNWGLTYIDDIWQIANGKDNYPMVGMTWWGAKAFCEYYGWRLPTESEWEFAARGGEKSKGYTYSGSNNLDDVGWYYGNSSRITYAIGSKKANELSIYDMSGNLWEWCADIYGEYPSTDQSNPHGADSGHAYILRGGAWSENEYYSRITCRENYDPPPFNKNAAAGFRCAADIK